MIGSRVGSQGPLYGSAVGSGADDEGPGGIPGVTRDGTSRIYAPATDAEWTAFMSAIGLATGNPSHIWNMQEAAGNLVDVVAGANLVPNNAPTYSNPVPGWSRLAVGTVDATANQRFSSNAAALPDISTTSALLLAYVGFQSAPGGVRGVVSLGTTRADARHNGTSPRLVSGANIAQGVGVLGSQVRPWVNRVDLAAGTNHLLTDQEKVQPAIGALTGRLVEVGSTGAAPASTLFLYAVLFTGAEAELSDAQVKTLLQGLGWAIPWS